MTRRLAPALALAASLAASLAAAPAAAQDGEMSEGLDLLREGSRPILEGLVEEMRPMLDEVRPFLEDEMLPFLERLGALVDDLAAYQMPERLPNGDILIRRRPDAPPPPPLPDAAPETDPGTDLPPDPGAEIEL